MEGTNIKNGCDWSKCKVNPLSLNLIKQLYSKYKFTAANNVTFITNSW